MYHTCSSTYMSSVYVCAVSVSCVSGECIITSVTRTSAGVGTSGGTWYLTATGTLQTVFTSLHKVWDRRLFDGMQWDRASLEVYSRVRHVYASINRTL